MYKVRRTERYHYAADLAQDIEEHQCVSCVFREDGEYPMCTPVSTGILLEESIPVLDERFDGVVVCTRYKKGERLPPYDEHQGALFD